MLRLRMSEALPLLPLNEFMCKQGQLIHFLKRKEI